MDEKPWWHETGLQFECSQCGDCCTGAPGYVWVNREEITALAATVGLEVAEFEERYVRTVGIRKTLDEHANGDCVFFDGKTRKCTVYEARPRQCRTWPFWESNLRSPETWKRTCEVCPGSGQGPVVPTEKVLHQLSVIRI